MIEFFTTSSKADEVKQAFLAEGYSAKIVTSEGGTEINLNAAEISTSEGIGQKISNFFHGLTRGDEDVHHSYAEGVNTGGALVGVACGEDEVAGLRHC